MPSFAWAHVPSMPPGFCFIATHATHVPSQATLQQTPSTQNPELHSPGRVHVRPVTMWFLQVPEVSSQNFPPHCASAVQAARHPPFTQTWPVPAQSAL